MKQCIWRVVLATALLAPAIMHADRTDPALDALKQQMQQMHLVARNMRQFTVLASLIGGVTAFIGFWLAYQWDLPVGPTDVTLAGIVYGIVFLAKTLFDLTFRRSQARHGLIAGGVQP